MNYENPFSRPMSEEMISSWLRRVAIDLGFGATKDLLKALGWPVCKNSEIDFACPEALLRKISDVTDTDIMEVHRHTFSSIKKIDLPFDRSFSADKTGYIWGQSSNEVLRQVAVLTKAGCGSLIIKRPSDSAYGQFQRELAFRELLKTPAGGTFAFTQYEKLALSLDELVERLKKAISEKINVHFAESGAIISTRQEANDLRNEIICSGDHLRYSKSRKSLTRPISNGSILSDDEQLSIFEAYCSGKSTVSQLCLQYGVSYAPIYRCLHRINGNNGLPEISGSTKRRAGRVAGRNKLADNVRPRAPCRSG